MRLLQEIRGLTLPELAVTLVIVGVLATLGVSRFNAYIARARQAEAKVNLAHILSLQAIWKADYHSYNALPSGGGVGASKCANTNAQHRNELGFRPKGCSEMRYVYTWNSTAANANSSGKEIYPGCTEFDAWSAVYGNLNINNTDPNVIKKCKD